MNKKIGVYFIGLLLVMSIFVSLAVSVNAAEASSTGIFSGFGDAFNLSARWDLWELGSDNLSQDQLGLLGETVKYLVLILVSLAIYGALSAMEFPKGPVLRMFLSIVIGLLGTFMITTKELLTVLISYSALTMTILIAVPFIVILGFTVLSAYKANAAGLYASRILWAVLAIFLICKALNLLLLFNYFVVIDNGTLQNHSYMAVDKNATIPTWVFAFIPSKKSDTSAGYQSDNARIGQIIGNADISTVWVLLFVGLAIMWFMVINGRWIYQWLEKEARDSAIEAAKNNIRLSAARDKLQADAMRDVSKT